MMLRLYKFNCEPNHPVCKGELIFAVKDWQPSETMLVVAKELASENGFSNFNEDATIEYLGSFMPAIEHPEVPYIISCQTGEY